MNYRRLTQKELLDTLAGWSKFIKKKVHLIACGGTAMTLLGVKSSTKDVDFIVPDAKEHTYVTRVLNDLGYKNENVFRWRKENEFLEVDVFEGKRIHTTELLESPLKEGNHIFLQNVGRIYLGVLNYYDLIASKLVRGSSVDFEDCLMLVRAKAKEIHKERLMERYQEMISYDIAQERLKGHLASFLSRWENEVS